MRLNSLINDLQARVSLKYPGLELTAHLPDHLTTIDADPKRLIQVLENLVSNAVKYAPGSPVDITIIQDEQLTTLLIKDHGPGIPNFYINHLFERFFRIPENSNGVHGSGLGLYICKKIITAHNGAISANSTVGEGATFKIDIPNQQ